MLTRPDAAYLDGAWRAASGARIDLIDPATESVIGQTLDSSADTVRAAVGAARRALDSRPWSSWDLEQRIDICGRMVTRLAERMEEHARLQTTQMGVPIISSRAMLAGNRNLFNAYVDGALATPVRYLRRDAVGQSVIRRVPVGVVGAIVPWNGPLPAALNKIVPALLAGCTMVLKPAPETPLDACSVAELFTAEGLPDGVLNVIPGGRGTGMALVEADGVDKITFTGSTASGRVVGTRCGQLLRRQSLELGGKSPGIVLEDADLDQVVPQIVSGNFFNSGQICVAITRVLVPRARHDEIVDAVRAQAATLVVGDPNDDATQIGPLATRAQRDRVEQLIASGIAQGAAPVLGGGRPSGRDRGWFIEPTIFTGVTPDMRIAREEIFGPVLSVLVYDDEEQAVAMANDGDYGLHGAVFGADLEHAAEIAGRIHSGSVAINVAGLTPGTPYGGLKSSGIGREHGREGFAAFLDYRATVVPATLAEKYESDGLPVR